MQAWHDFFLSEKNLDLTPEEIRRRCIGPGTMDIFRDFFGNTLSPAKMDELCERKEECYRAAVREKKENMALRKGAPEFLDRLAAQNFPFVLATASPKSNVEFYLSELGLSRWFKLTDIVYEDGLRPGKPDPAFYLEAVRRAGVSPPGAWSQRTP